MESIQVLSTDLANKIAAGEVIERPASVVKELIENSLDADANQITVNLIQSGFARIQVSDNGQGISKTDLPLALASHATSKIKTAKDLNTILSLGFRGEALASIQSVSRCTLQSQTHTDGSAFQVKNIEDPMIPTPVAHPVGTTVTVDDLFYNVPARRKFLRSKKTEFAHCEEVIRRIALSRFDVAFTLIHDKRTVFQLPIALTRQAQEKRLYRLLGKAFLADCVNIDLERAGLHWYGWIGLPSLSRSQLDRQYCFVNGRVIRDKLLNHAIRQAYADHLPIGRYPYVVLFLKCDPSTIDVNVHPTKHEVRFYDARLVHDGLVHSLKRVLNQSEDPIESSNVAIEPIAAVGDPISRMIPARQTMYRDKARATLLESKTQMIGVVHQRYLILSDSAGVRIIDAIKAHELWVVRQLANSIKEEKNLKIQPLLLPVQASLPAGLCEHWDKIEKQLSNLGIVTVLLSPTSINLRYIPALLHGLDANTFLHGLIQKLQQSRWRLTTEALIYFIATSAAYYLKKTGIDTTIGQKILSEINEVALESCSQLISLDLTHRHSVKQMEDAL